MKREAAKRWCLGLLIQMGSYNWFWIGSYHCSARRGVKPPQ